ncbi:hypothetical protein OAN67_02825 [Pelagibacteraceae bacterium]|nr:hypothetical protein [Pelagibacteraceae bacterium]
MKKKNIKIINFQKKEGREIVLREAKSKEEKSLSALAEKMLN